MTFVPVVARSDNIDLFVCDRYGNRQGSLSGAVINKITWSLPQFGMSTAEINVSKVDSQALLALLIAHELQIVFNDIHDIGTGQPLCWWGTFAGRKSDDSSPLTFVLYDIAAWFKVRIVENATLTYTEIDQFDIGWDLVLAAQGSIPAYDLNITASYAPSGHARSRIYQRDQHKIIWDALLEFPTLLNGFEWDIQYDLAAGHRIWTPYYPQKGSLIANPKFWFVKGGLGNIATYKYEQNAFDSVATKIFATGGTANGVKFEQQYEDVTARDMFGAMVRVVSDGSQIDPDWLLDRAHRTVDQKKWLPLSLKMKVKQPAATGYPDTTPVSFLGNVRTGDTIYISIDNDADQIVTQQRVSQIQWNSDDSVDVSLIDPTTVQIN